MPWQPYDAGAMLTSHFTEKETEAQKVFTTCSDHLLSPQSEGGIPYPKQYEMAKRRTADTGEML